MKCIECKPENSVLDNDIFIIYCSKCGEQLEEVRELYQQEREFLNSLKGKVK